MHIDTVKVIGGALSGLAAAVAIDLHAFKTFKSGADIKAYDWGLALFRWTVGVVSGAIVGLGYGALLS